MNWKQTSMLTLCLIALMRFTSPVELSASITDIPIGKYVMNQELGFQYLNEDGKMVDAKKLFDYNLSTSYVFDKSKKLILFLDKEKGKVPYPCDGIFLTNGNDSKNPNRIKTIEVEFRQKQLFKKWVFHLHDTLQFQFLSFPEPIFLGQKSQIAIRPILLYPNCEAGELSELAISSE